MKDTKGDGFSWSFHFSFPAYGTKVKGWGDQRRQKQRRSAKVSPNHRLDCRSTSEPLNIGGESLLFGFSTMGLDRPRFIAGFDSDSPNIAPPKKEIPFKVCCIAGQQELLLFAATSSSFEKPGSPTTLVLVGSSVGSPVFWGPQISSVLHVHPTRRCFRFRLPHRAIRF